MRTGKPEFRRSRRLVISSFSTIGNYDYGFFWYLYQDGTIECEVKLTGILSTGAVAPGETPRYGQLLNDDGLYGPIHQHFFNFRLDLDVDGPVNTVYEEHAEADPPGPGNPLNAAFRTPSRTALRRESEAQQLIDPLRGADLEDRQPGGAQRGGRTGRLPAGAARRTSAPSPGRRRA